MSDTPKFAIIIVTYNRRDLLELLLRSLEKLTLKPQLVTIINNASSDDTPTLVREWIAQNPGLRTQLIDLDQNTGGAGGFRAGMRYALKSDADWFWLMDDDVKVVPEALNRATRWTKQFDAFMGQRLTPHGSIVNWSHRLGSWTGLAPLIPRNPFSRVEATPSNSGCFEGMFVSRDAVTAVGLPDSRFFLTWDDAVYGWLIARQHRVGYVKDVFLQRTLEMRSVGPKSFTVYARNNLARYYFIRNRAIQRKYWGAYNELSRFGFALGTIRIVMIEIIRSLLIERKIEGLRHINRAIRDMRKMQRDTSFHIPEIDSEELPLEATPLRD